MSFLDLFPPGLGEPPGRAPPSQRLCPPQRRGLWPAPRATRAPADAATEGVRYQAAAPEAEAVPADWLLSTVFRISTLACSSPSCPGVAIISTPGCSPHSNDSFAPAAGRSSELCNLKLRVEEIQGQGPAHLPPAPRFPSAWISAWHVFQTRFMFSKFREGAWMPATGDKKMIGSLNPWKTIRTGFSDAMIDSLVPRAPRSQFPGRQGGSALLSQLDLWEPGW